MPHDMELFNGISRWFKKKQVKKFSLHCIWEGEPHFSHYLAVTTSIYWNERASLLFMCPICHQIENSKPKFTFAFCTSVTYLAIAEHSMCHPGRPFPQGDSQNGSPGFTAFHKTKSSGFCFSESTLNAIKDDYFRL